MIIPGSLVACRYQETFYGIVVQLNQITSEEIRRELARQYQELRPHFAVHFLENDEYDCIALENVSPVQQQDIYQHEESRDFSYYKKLIAEGRIVLKNGFYIAADAQEAIFPVACGSPIPYEVITSTRYYASEIYLKQLFEKNSYPFSKEQVMALSCLQNYKQPVLGRYPSIPNYKNFAYFGNKLLRDYAGVYLSPAQILCINDVCYVDNEAVRVERIVKIESQGQQQFLIAGVNTVGVPFVGVSGQIVIDKAQVSNISFETKPPKLYTALVDPISADTFGDSDYVPQSDADNRFGNNFTKFSGLFLQKSDTRLAPASALDLLTAKYQFVQNKLIPLSPVPQVQIEANQNIYSNFKTPQIASNSFSGTGKAEYTGPVPSPGIQQQVSTVKNESQQNTLTTPSCNVASPEVAFPIAQQQINFQQCRLLSQINYAYDLSVEMIDHVLSVKEIERAAKFYQQNFLQFHQGQSKDSQTTSDFNQKYDQLIIQKGLKCCFCGQNCGNDDHCFIFGLPMLKRPVFQAVFNPPIILGCHKSCIEKVPEVVIQEWSYEKDLDGHSDSEGSQSDEISDQSLGKEEPLIQLLHYAKMARSQINRQTTLIYDGLRKALKPERIGLKCHVCGGQGAVIGCFNQYCQFTAHYPCVKDLFKPGQGKTFYCEKHAPK